jgi:hypothetical protein
MDRHRLMLEPLEKRELLAGDTIPVNFVIPADVAAKEVYLSVFATLLADYTNANNDLLRDGTVVVFDPSVGTDGDYVDASTAASLTYELPLGTPVVDLPNTYVKAGQIVIGVGSAPIVTYSSGIATPTSSTNPDNYFALFEYALDAGGLDIDVSNVDQVGFPFTVMTDPAPPLPANEGVGITQHRGDLFNMYGEFIAAQGAGAAEFQKAITYGDGYRILAPQNFLDGNQAPNQDPFTSANYAKGGSLVIQQDYYYWVTATNGDGETAASNVQQAVPYNKSTSKGNVPMQTAIVTWDEFTGATGYNIYRSTTNDSTTANLVGSVNSGSTLSFNDTGKAGTATPPPTSSYTYHPLNSYFNDALDAFFTHYETNTFTMDRDGYTFTGTVETDYKIFYGQGQHDYHEYTVLPLTTPDLANQEFLIIKPYFEENTNIADAPPAPTWMPHPTQSPGAMILANDGAFNTGGAQPNVDAGVLSDLQNSIVSAFNRGIASNFNIHPNNWASQPQINTAEASAGGQLTPNTKYYYVMTATNADGETTTSIERMIETTTTDLSATFTWTAHNSPTQYNIYRSTTPGTGYQLVGTIANPDPHTTDPVTGYTDDGSSTPIAQTPPMYYGAGTASNWYSAFLHQNSTTNPANGVSINGLAYGYAYDDQGGSSTNFQFVGVETVTVTIQPWGTNPSPPPQPTPPTPPGPTPNPHPNPHPAPPAPDVPASIQFLVQPTAGKKKSMNTVEFKVLTSQGHTFFGGTDVKVELVGLMKGSYTVLTDDSTGIGTLDFKNSKVGPSMLKLTLEDGSKFYSNVFQVGPQKSSKAVIKALDKADKYMNTSAIRAALNLISNVTKKKR